jgi:hypothetical protein
VNRLILIKGIEGGLTDFPVLCTNGNEVFYAGKRGKTISNSGIRWKIAIVDGVLGKNSKT